MPHFVQDTQSRIHRFEPQGYSMLAARDIAAASSLLLPDSSQHAPDNCPHLLCAAVLSAVLSAALAVALCCTLLGCAVLCRAVLCSP